jgi:hypothetical protein
MLNSIVYGIQLFWAGVEAVRESSDKELIQYYGLTLLPILFGILAPVLLGKYLVIVPPTETLAWAGVGALISNLIRDFFCNK